VTFHSWDESLASDSHGLSVDSYYTVSQKRDPDVIDCNFEKD